MEAQRVDELVTAASRGGAAVLGLEPSLLTVVEERVRLLVVEEDLAPTGECPSCRFLTATEQESCPLCGTALHPQPDAVELALRRVLDQNGEIEVLRSAPSRRALEPHGGIGALLRYAYAPAAEPADEDEPSDPQKE